MSCSRGGHQPKSQRGRACRNAELPYLEQSHTSVGEKSPPSLPSLRPSSHALTPEGKAACLMALEILCVALSPSRARFPNMKVDSHMNMFLKCCVPPPDKDPQRHSDGHCHVRVLIYLSTSMHLHTHTVCTHIYAVKINTDLESLLQGVPACVCRPSGRPAATTHSDSSKAELAPFPDIPRVLQSSEGPSFAVGITWPCYKTGESKPVFSAVTPHLGGTSTTDNPSLPTAF